MPAIRSKDKDDINQMVREYGLSALVATAVEGDEYLTSLETEQELRRVENEESNLLIEHQRNALIKVLEMIGDSNPTVTEFITAALGE